MEIALLDVVVIATIFFSSVGADKVTPLPTICELKRVESYRSRKRNSFNSNCTQASTSMYGVTTYPWTEPRVNLEASMSHSPVRNFEETCSNPDSGVTEFEQLFTRTNPVRGYLVPNEMQPNQSSTDRVSYAKLTPQQPRNKYGSLKKISEEPVYLEITGP